MAKQRTSDLPVNRLLALHLVVVALGTAALADPAHADGAFSDQRRSLLPWHRAQDGNGRTIPCVCSVKGQLVPLGTSVCLWMPSGLQIARCDLNQNVTSWVPTGVPCTTSRIKRDPSSGDEVPA